MPRTTTAHETATPGVVHPGEYAACLQCNNISFYYSLRTFTGRLLWDGIDEAEGLSLLGKDAEYRLYREVWQEQEGRGVLLRTERIGPVGRLNRDRGRVETVIEVIED